MARWKEKGLLALAAGGLVLGLPRGSEACSLAVGTLTVDPQEREIDKVPPEAPSVLEVRVHRGRSANPSTSCDDVGWIGLRLAPSADDRPLDDALGYSFTSMTGEPPEGFSLPDKPYLASRDGWIYLHWIDGSRNDQESFDFGAVVHAVDRAGNVSAKGASFQAADTGAEGCTVAIGRKGSGAPIVSLFLLLACLPLRRLSRRRR